MAQFKIGQLVQSKLFDSVSATPSGCEVISITETPSTASPFYTLKVGVMSNGEDVVVSGIPEGMITEL